MTLYWFILPIKPLTLFLALCPLNSAHCVSVEKHCYFLACVWVDFSCFTCWNQQNYIFSIHSLQNLFVLVWSQTPQSITQLLCSVTTLCPEMCWYLWWLSREGFVKPINQQMKSLPCLYNAKIHRQLSFWFITACIRAADTRHRDIVLWMSERRCGAFFLAVQFGGASGQQPGSNLSALQDEAQKPKAFFLL